MALATSHRLRSRQAFDEVGRPDDPVEELRALGLAYRRSALDRPHLYAVMFDCPVPEFTPSEADDAFALARLERLRSAVARAVDVGAVVGNDMEITFALWGLVHGLASLELSGVPAGLDADAVWAQALGAMLAGLAPD
ncbi:TetR-like C-terminal domain-containing protein [Euzebya pacifica]|nr:TetR-like C-terminal domain-containing protein [Euzebya pacifica]